MIDLNSKRNLIFKAAQWLAVLGCASALLGCTKQEPLDNTRIQNLEREVASLKKNMENLKPGLGEIMATIHLHHAKLYFSGKAENWDLATYQINEIKEDLDQATELHEHIPETSASLKDLRHVTDSGISSIESAIRDKSKVQFMDGFKKLTSACNQCHQAAGRKFVVIHEPRAPMFSNQKFTRPTGEQNRFSGQEPKSKIK